MMQDSFNLSDGQKQDLVFLRRVYLLKLQELNQQQIALSAQLQNHTGYALSDFPRVAAITAQLRRNAAARYQLVHRFSWSAYFGVSKAHVYAARLTAFSHLSHTCTA